MVLNTKKPIVYMDPYGNYHRYILHSLMFSSWYSIYTKHVLALYASLIRYLHFTCFRVSSILLQGACYISRYALYELHHSETLDFEMRTCFWTRGSKWGCLKLIRCHMRDLIFKFLYSELECLNQLSIPEMNLDNFSFSALRYFFNTLGI